MILLNNIKYFLYKIKKKYRQRAFAKKLYVTKNVDIDTSSIGFMNVFYEGDNGVPARCQFIGKEIHLGYRTTLGYNNLLGGNVSIGKYCQLGSDVAFHATNHPMSFMTSYINKNLFGGELKNLKQEGKIIVGHDVWIGHGVIILSDVTIGNGAILAAGSVITKDVDPFSIVAGVPAKVIRKRFPEEIIKEIDDLKWWDKSDSELAKIKPLFFKDFTNRHSIYD